MADKNLEKIMGREWEQVRKGFYYPQLPQPKLVENIPNGCIDIKSLQTKVSETFIKDLREKGVPENESLNEVLTHELTHFMKYPGSVLNVLRLQKAGRDYADDSKVSELRTAFTEAQTNIYMVKEKNHPSTVKMRRVVRPDENDSFGRLMYGLYQEIWKQDLGVKLNGEERALVKKLKDIDFLDKKQELNNFKRFVQTLKDYQPSQDKQGGDGKNQQQGQGGGQGKNYGQCQGNQLGMFDDNQIREGIRQFAQECDNPGEFEDIVKEILSQEEEKQKEVQSHGINPGTDRRAMMFAKNFYTALAENYSIPIRKKPMKKNGSLYPHSHDSFSVSDPLSELDPFSTPGILPGITKKWQRKEGEVATDFESVPDSIITIDNSGSMPNPEESISVPVLGGTAISNAYLINDAKVAVYSFGGNDNLQNLTANREVIHRALRGYTGGGTRFNPHFLESVLKEHDREFDISVISDMAIGNLDSFIDTVLKIPKIHRIHLIYTNDEAMEYVNQLKSKFGRQENIAILPLLYEKDINKIVMGELTKSVR